MNYREQKARDYLKSIGYLDADYMAVDAAVVELAATLKTNERLRQRVKELEAALKSAQEHLEFCGYGDSYERECARIEGLAESIKKALEGSDV